MSRVMLYSYYNTREAAHSVRCTRPCATRKSARCKMVVVVFAHAAEARVLRLRLCCIVCLCRIVRLC